MAAFALFISTARFAPAQSQGTPGVFDFYLLTLSWSPEFCHGHPNAPQCSEKLGFIVHGLWPQYNNGTWPLNCPTNNPAPTDTSSVSQIMPPSILQHEWEKHGTCSGLSGNDYFRLIRRIFDSLKMPGDLTSPTRSFTLTPAALKKDFENTNSSLADQDIAIQLNHGYLNAVEICFSKGATPAPIACTNVTDIHGGTFKIPPVR